MSISDITPINGGNPSGSALDHWSAEEQRVIREQVAGGMEPPITDAELRWFASVCQARRLSPIAGQIVPVRRGGRMVIQVTIHGLRSIADATGDYAPGRRSSFESDGQGNLVSATAYVMKHARGTWHQVEETAYWEEYAEYTNDRRTGDRRLTQMWAGKPRLMLAKVAEALALRRAFPAQLGALYTDDELGRDEPARPMEPAPRVTPAELSGKRTPRQLERLEPEQRRAVPKAPGPDLSATDFWRQLREAGWDTETVQQAAQDNYGRSVQNLDRDQRAELLVASLAGRIKADAAGRWLIEPVGGEPAPEPTVEAPGEVEDGKAF